MPINNISYIVYCFMSICINFYYPTSLTNKSFCYLSEGFIYENSAVFVP